MEIAGDHCSQLANCVRESQQVRRDEICCTYTVYTIPLEVMFLGLCSLRCESEESQQVGKLGSLALSQLDSSSSLSCAETCSSRTCQGRRGCGGQ